jgi:glycosyltransferase involved in cell wall biosynthesis
MLQIFFWTNIFLAFYAYFGYPLFLRCLPKRKTNFLSLNIDSNLPKLTVIISARNEQEVIKEKIENTLSLSYFGKERDRKILQILIASDASDDATHSIVEEYKDQGVELVALPDRLGKESAQKAALARATGEVIVFTDAKIKLNQRALEHFAYYFTDDSIGAVSSTDQVESNDGADSGEGFYVRYEMWLRQLESRGLGLVGLSGSCFAARKNVCSGWRVDIPSDFTVLLLAVKSGLVGVIADEIIGSYKSVKTEEAEFLRKVRTILRGITTFFSCAEILNPFQYGTFSWQIISHKLLRWLVPVFLMLALVIALILSTSSKTYLLMAGVMMSFLLLALIAFFISPLRKIKIFKIPLYFSITNLAIMVAWFKFLTGRRSVTWSPTNR